VFVNSANKQTIQLPIAEFSVLGGLFHLPFAMCLLSHDRNFAATRKTSPWQTCPNGSEILA